MFSRLENYEEICLTWWRHHYGCSIVKLNIPDIKNIRDILVTDRRSWTGNIVLCGWIYEHAENSDIVTSTVLVSSMLQRDAFNPLETGSCYGIEHIVLH